MATDSNLCKQRHDDTNINANMNFIRKKTTLIDNIDNNCANAVQTVHNNKIFEGIEKCQKTWYWIQTWAVREAGSMLTALWLLVQRSLLWELIAELIAMIFVFVCCAGAGAANYSFEMHATWWISDILHATGIYHILARMSQSHAHIVVSTEGAKLTLLERVNSSQSTPLKLWPILPNPLTLVITGQIHDSIIYMVSSKNMVSLYIWSPSFNYKNINDGNLHVQGSEKATSSWLPSGVSLSY